MEARVKPHNRDRRRELGIPPYGKSSVMAEGKQSAAGLTSTSDIHIDFLVFDEAIRLLSSLEGNVTRIDKKS
jgi:hypothetical protein